MFIELDSSAEEPLFQQLYRGIIGAIATGELPDGTPLDSVRKVAAEFGINPATVKKAYDLLRSDGLLDTKNRTKSIVRLPTQPATQVVASIRQELRLLVDRARAQGMSTADLNGLLDAAVAESQETEVPR